MRCDQLLFFFFFVFLLLIPDDILCGSKLLCECDSRAISLTSLLPLQSYQKCVDESDLTRVGVVPSHI